MGHTSPRKTWTVSISSVQHGNSPIEYASKCRWFNRMLSACLPLQGQGLYWSPSPGQAAVLEVSAEDSALYFFEHTGSDTNTSSSQHQVHRPPMPAALTYSAASPVTAIPMSRPPPSAALVLDGSRLPQAMLNASSSLDALLIRTRLFSLK
ncbi:uncharacterized protein LOC115802132 isoform X3 [Delphinapterus leucas]|uniref:Uncharacterized protein LOC115802132 isoform X3 n=1 Tax=Delphinapterus leucas TaxID=9749 RepID=A0A7F8K6X7_DELLE|nr:uncharacterized protein LOC115802132 isoform X3 [Delphinapterus leucas]